MADSTPLTGMAALMAIVTTPTPGYGKQPVTYFDDRTLEELSDEADSVYGVGTMEAPSEDPTVEEFLSWHIYEQLDLIPDIELDSNGNILSGVTEIGTAPDTVTVVKSVSGDRIYVIDLLQKRDIAGIPAEDQAVIAQTSKWLNNISIALAMVPSSETPTIEAARAEHTVAIEALQSEISNISGFDGDAFIGQLEYLLEDVNAMEIISPETVNEKLGEIEERFRRAEAFNVELTTIPSKDDFIAWPKYTEGYAIGDEIDEYAIYNAEDQEGGSGSWIIYDREGDFNSSEQVDAHYNSLADSDIYDMDESPFAGLISTDGNAALRKTYETFIAQEKEIYAIETQIRQVSKYGSINEKNLDLPSLISVMMMLTGMKLDAQIVADTAMLEAITERQKALNEVVDIFNEHISTLDATNASNKTSLLNSADGSSGKFDLERIMQLSPHIKGLDGGENPVDKVLDMPVTVVELIEWPEKPSNSPKRYSQIGDDKSRLDPINDSNTLKENDYVLEIDTSYKWKKYTKTSWDSIANRFSSANSQYSQAVQMRQSDLTNASSQSTQWQNKALSVLTEMTQMVTRIGNNI